MRKLVPFLNLERQFSVPGMSPWYLEHLFKSAKLGHVLSTKGTFQICTPQQFLQNILLYLFFGIIGKKSLPEKWIIFFDISTLLLQNIYNVYIYRYKPYLRN